MRKTYCDVCGKELDYEENLSPIEIRYNNLWRGHTRNIDLCSECKEKFEEYIDKYLDGSLDEGN